jgi:iron complex outermembrane receptor protein
VPNLRVNSPFSETQPNFTVRGIGVANEFNPNAQSPIGVYFDEVYQGFRASHGATLFDLERIEVLKGPQGTLYGRNTTGGAINIITRQPTLEGNNGYLALGYGNFDRLNMTAAAETTLVQDRLGLRVVMTRLYRKGVIDNVTARYGATNPYVGNKDYDSVDSWAGRATLRAKPTETLDLNLRGYFSNQKPIGTTGVVVQLSPGGSDITGTTLPGLGDRESAATNQGRYRTKTWGVSLKSDLDLGAITLTSVSGYDHATLRQPFDFDGSPSLIGQWDPNTARFESFGQDIHASYSSERLKLIGGGYFGWQQVDMLNRYYYLGFFNALAGPGQFNPAGQFFPPPAPPTAIDAQQQLTQSQWTYAAYLEAEIALADRLKLTLGGRLTHEKVKLSNFSSLLFDSSRNPALYTYSSSGANWAAPGAPVLTGIVPDISRAITKPTGRAILSYDLTSKSMLYASYSRGYRSGSFNGQSIVPVPNFVPAEFVDAFEAGFKSRFFGNDLQINGALFYNKYKGQQVQEIQNGAAFLRSLNGRMWGFELDVKAKPHRLLRIDASLGYLNTRYNNGQFLAPGDPAATDPRGISLGGNSFPFAPSWTASIAPTVTLAETGNGLVSLRADVNYASKQYFDPFNDRQAAGPLRNGQKGYALVDASLRYDSDAFSVSVWSRNLFDTYYKAYGLNIESFGFDFFTPGAPRTFGIEGTVRF